MNKLINFDTFYDFMDKKGIDFTIATRYNSKEYILLSYTTFHDTENAINEYFKTYPDHTDIKKVIENGIVFSDEHSTCDDCGCICLLPESDYSYYKEGWFNYDLGYFQCTECMKKYNKEDYIEYHKNNPKRIIILLSVEDMKEQGYEQLSEASENGFYGIAQDPKAQY